MKLFLSLLYKFLRRVGKKLIGLRNPTISNKSFMYYLEWVTALGSIFKWSFKIYVWCLMLIAGAFVFDLTELEDLFKLIYEKWSSIYNKVVDLIWGEKKIPISNPKADKILKKIEKMNHLNHSNLINLRDIDYDVINKFPEDFNINDVEVEDKNMSTTTKILIGLGILAAIGGGLYIYNYQPEIYNAGKDWLINLYNVIISNRGNGGGGTGGAAGPSGSVNPFNGNPSGPSGNPSAASASSSSSTASSGSGSSYFGRGKWTENLGSSISSDSTVKGNPSSSSSSNYKP